MLIILEGPDGSGKSHLARDLEELLQRANPHDTVEVIHSSAPTQHPLDEYQRRITWYRPGEGNHLILDRFHWGEFVYPEIFQRPTKLTANHLWHIENYLLRLGAIVVQCQQYSDEYKRVYTQRNEPYEMEILGAVERRYREVRKTTHLPVVDYNWMSPVWGDQHRIVQAAEQAESSFIELAKFKTYVGPRKPDFLLLGDVRHGKVDVNYHGMDPAFVPHGKTSGDFLLSALLNGDEQGRNFKFGLANACDIDDPYRLWLALGQPRVVALGKNSMRKLSGIVRIVFDSNHTWGAVPHPQYVRRFHHRDQWAYGQNIRMAARHGGDYSQWHAQLKAEADRMSTVKSSKTFAGAVSDASPATA